MPVVGVYYDELMQALGANYSEEEFDELCFEYGIELDDVTSERKMREKETSIVSSDLSDRIIYKIDIPANRYDMLCLEGISRALKVFIGKEDIPVYRAIKPDNPIRIKAHPDVKKIRPVVVAAVLRNVAFNESVYKSFIDLQDKLHQNLGRNRSLVSIGTHDLDTIKPPFSYEALPPNEIEFIPLDDSKAYTAAELMTVFEKNLHLRRFLHLIRDSPVYPVIYDSNRTVLSLPPIINGDHSKIKLSTRNVFIEITATDATKASITLNTMVTMFSEHCSERFTVEMVEVVDTDGQSDLFPKLTPRVATASVDYLNSSLGISLRASDIVQLLRKMSLQSKVASNGKDIEVEVPPTRSDIMHACDIMEDVGIAYSFNKLPREVPKTVTVGMQQPISKLTDKLRNEMAQAGFLEVLTLSLVSHKENYEMLNQPEADTAVVLSNPKTVDFQEGRVTLLAGLLKSLRQNQYHALPLRIFEVSDVMLLDSSTSTGARNCRKLCALYCNTTDGFEIIHGIVDFLMMKLGVSPGDSSKGYFIVESSNPTFLESRRVDILVDGKKIGHFGVIHPDVLCNFDIPNPTSALEIDIESFI